MSSVILVHRSLHFSQYVFVVVTMGDKERILSPLQMHFMSHHNFANLREICNITTLASLVVCCCVSHQYIWLRWMIMTSLNRVKITR